MAFTLQQLRYFVAAAELGSVTGAARELNISQPSVSAAIRKLEDQFSAQLVLRHHAQGISLTAAGRRFMSQARSLIAQAQALESDTRGLGGDLGGNLELGCYLSFAPFLLPGLLRGFSQDHPDVTVRLRENDHESLRRELETGGLEIALLYDLGFGQDLTVEPLAELLPYALLPADHPLARTPTVALRDLAQEPMILLDLPTTREYFLTRFRALGLDPVIGLRTTSYETIRGLVANGLGYSVLVMRPHGDRAYDGRRLACRPIAEPVPPTRIVLARSAAIRPSPVAEAFAARARAYIPAAIAGTASK
ncbi:MAG: LysR family transcriptional regulator [Rhodospirillaceae bacterium]|jgi:DNA-binding transcriptional LysR family regulator|nr:LysR family transcriptional regulator [Rhodospirillaceae bacterium]MBT6118923.1 LysR family transcriptional regulator [Rhodospirillaceae bacterium]